MCLCFVARAPQTALEGGSYATLCLRCIWAKKNLEQRLKLTMNHNVIYSTQLVCVFSLPLYCVCECENVFMCLLEIEWVGGGVGGGCVDHEKKERKSSSGVKQWVRLAFTVATEKNLKTRCEGVTVGVHGQFLKNLMFLPDSGPRTKMLYLTIKLKNSVWEFSLLLSTSLQESVH